MVRSVVLERILLFSFTYSLDRHHTGTIALFDKSNALILFNLPTATPRQNENKHKTYESWLSSKSKPKSLKEKTNQSNDADDGSSSSSSSSSGSDDNSEESNDAMSLLLMIDENSQNLPLSHPGNIVATSMRTTTTVSSKKTTLDSVNKSATMRDDDAESKYFADSDSDASSLDEDDMLYWRTHAFGPNQHRTIADPDHNLDVVTSFQSESEMSSPLGLEPSKDEKEEEEEEEFSLDGGNRRLVKETSSPSMVSSKVSTIVEETPKPSPSSSSSSLITILNTTSVFPELESYGRIRYDLYSTKAQELCSRNVNVCKELRHGALSERCWKSLSAAFGEKNTLSPIVASTLPLMCNMLFQRQDFESVASLASVGIRFVSKDKMRREDREVLRFALSSYSDASFRRRDDVIAHTFLRRAASNMYAKEKEDKEEESKHVPATPPPPPTPPISSSPRT